MPWPKDETKKSEPSAAVDREADLRLLDFVANASRGTAARTGDMNDDILYAGMNPSSASAELAGLRAGGANVTALRAEHDVHDTLAFAKSIGLKGEQAERVAAVLTAAGPHNGELAAIAKAWASGTVPSRLVLSGHSGGSDVHAGDHVIRFADLQRLAAAMPAAAACVEDVHFSGCNTGLEAVSKDEREQWLRAFPNLQTLWGYQGSCPMAPGGDMQVWESRTRGRAHLDLGGLEKTGVVISDRFGHIDGAAVRRPFAAVKADFDVAEKAFPNLFAGHIPKWGAGEDDPYGPLYQTYQAYRLAEARDDMSSDDRATAKTKADQLLRLRCWPSVCKHFQAEHRSELGSAGLDFTTLTREEAIAKIDAALPKASDSLGKLLRDFKDLDPKLLPEDWCEHDVPS